MSQKDLLRIGDLTKREILAILKDAQAFSSSYLDWQLPQRRLIANLFFEPSTRTHYSFLSAEMQLGAKTADFSAQTSSVQKGESLYDTVKTFESIGYDAVVIRHSQERYFDTLSSIQIPILNAGDGCANHPTQSLLDLLTIYQEFGAFEGIQVAVIGDILHSRVAASIEESLRMLGGEVRFGGPEKWRRGDRFTEDIDSLVGWADVVIMLRIQYERHTESGREGSGYLERFGMNQRRMERMKPHAILMHPAPVNRGVEIEDVLVEHPKSRIFKQMANGVLVRKAVIKRAFGYSFENRDLS